MRKLAVLVCVFAVVAALFAGGPARAQSLPVEVERELNCICGCDINFEECVCSTSDAIREAASGLIASGRTTQEVLDGLVAQYGEEVLVRFAGNAGNSSADENPDISTPDSDPIVVDPEAGITIIEPDAVASAPTPGAGSIPGATGGSDTMTWLLPLLGVAGGGSVALVAVQVVRRRQEQALATRQDRRKQARRKSKRHSRR